MSQRFVLDESSWRLAWARRDELAAATDLLLMRVETAVDRSEGVARHADLYEADLGGGIALYAALFDPTCPLRLDRDLAERLRLAIDRAHVFDDEQLESYDAWIAGAVRFAPGVCWAHANVRSQRSVAVIPLALDDALSGALTVTVSGTECLVHHVTSESSHRAFFRHAVETESRDASSFAAIARSAFPDLGWVDGVWDGLRRHQRLFFGDSRHALVEHLSVLDDDGATLFHERPGGQGVAEELRARGVSASSENGNARKHNASIADRRRTYDGVEQVFWWHTKLCWDEGRIHFVYVPASLRRPTPAQGHIAVGIFTDHCVLP